MNQTVLGKSPQECCGCGACEVVCPKSAITMEENEFGFLYPAVNEEKCVCCGACVRICDYGNLSEGKRPEKAWAAVGKELPLVEKSASGGVFATLAKDLVASGGLTAGVVLDRNGKGFLVEHLLSGKKEDILRFQGAKYVQSQAWKCYSETLQALASGKTVLFSGTPCQVAAFKRLSGDPDNLITVDLICHGVPPLRMLNEFREIMSERLGGEVSNIVFRDKSCGKHFCARVDVIKNRKCRSYYLSAWQLSFYRYFLDGVIYRDNCYSCPYAEIRRISDLTVGDYWGIESYHAEDIAQGRMPDRKDWSCILVNTEKGENFLKKHGDMIRLYPSRPEWAAEKNGQLREPSRMPEKRKPLLERYASGGYWKMEETYIQESGGKLRFYWRMLKNLCQNKKLYRINKKTAYED